MAAPPRVAASATVAVAQAANQGSEVTALSIARYLRMKTSGLIGFLAGLADNISFISRKSLENPGKISSTIYRTTVHRDRRSAVFAPNLSGVRCDVNSSNL